MRHAKLAVAVLALSLVLILDSIPVSSHLETQAEIHAALHVLLDQGAITESMKERLEGLFEKGKTRRLARYIASKVERGVITASTGIYLQTLLDAGVPGPGEGVVSPVPSAFSGNGTVTKLGQLNPFEPFSYYGSNSSTGQTYQDLVGHAANGREYALLAHSQGLAIIDVTDPANPVALQFIAGVGGRINHDVDTYDDPVSGKTYAYFGGQQPADHVYSIDLSYLPGTIPPEAIVDLGLSNYAHTLQVTDGLLFTNSAGSLGCRVFDVQANPANPPLLPQNWSGSGRDCHDSFARDNLLYSADGYSTRWRIVDITGIRNGVPPMLIGETAANPGAYAHSGWLSDDSRYFFAFEEFNVDDINVYDVSTPSTPTNVRTFQWSGDQTANSKVHNGRVKGNLLYVAYYEAGLRVFDISNPLDPIEVGKYETWRDPDGNGTFDRQITGQYNGAWHVYTHLPSGNILVSDMLSGLFIFDVAQPSAPEPPNGLVAGAGADEVRLSWTASTDATRYNVKRGDAPGGPYVSVVDGVTTTSYTDAGLAPDTPYFYVVTAVNYVGESANSDEASATPGPSHVLTVALAGAGSGTVTTTPPGIACPGSCAEEFTHGAIVTLSAAASNGSTFMGWGGVCAGSTSCLLTMDAAKSASATFSPTGRDLIEASVGSASTLVSPGGSFGVADTARNQGSADAAGSVTRYYLSIDAVKSSNDTRLTGSRVVPALAAGTASPGTVSVTVPSTMATGTFTLFACADDTNLVPEVGGANNCTAAATTVTVTLTELVLTSVANPPTSAAPGTGFTAGDTVQNTSAVMAAASTVRYYLSPDTLKDPSDILLAGSRAVPSLLPGATSTGSRTVTIPTTIPTGVYYLLGCADDLLKVRETDETNNCLASATTVSVQWPDLVTTAVSNPPAAVAPGGKFVITDTVTNQGSGPAGTSKTQYYLSLDVVRDASDRLLSPSRSVPSLPSTAISTGSKNVTVPSTTPPGTYFVLACADDGLKVTESDEANNCRATTTVVVQN